MILLFFIIHLNYILQEILAIPFIRLQFNNNNKNNEINSEIKEENTAEYKDEFNSKNITEKKFVKHIEKVLLFI